MPSLNLKQSIAIVIAVLGVLAVSSANLTDLFGPHVAKLAVSAANLLTAVLGSVMAVITSQSGTVKDVLAMDGVERIGVNASANKTLAAIAVDPSVDKIAPTSG